MIRSVLPALTASIALLGACTGHEVEPRDAVVPSQDFFTDISDDSGMRVDNFYAEPAAGTQINDHSRLAFADLDGDGFDDIVMHSLFPNADHGVPFEHLVFLNDGAGGFIDHSDASGLRDVQAAFFAFGDLDNDGDQDLFAGLDLPSAGDNAVFLNDGRGVFTERTDSGVDEVSGMAANAVMADFDGDAILDLFVGMGGTTYIAQDHLFRGLGDGSFELVDDRMPDRPRQPSNGSVTCDWDDDGDLDIFVSTYSVSTENGLNHLWQNDGEGFFTEVAVDKGFASLPTGNTWLRTTGYGEDIQPDAEAGTFIGSNGFGIDCGDVNADGYLDILLTTISHPNTSIERMWSDPSQILINQGPDGDFTFVNEWTTRGLPFNEGDVDGALLDLDNDGALDISISRDRKYESSYDEDDQKSWFGLYRQQEDGSFVSLGVQSGINDADGELLRMKGAQNHAWSDTDGDGDLDLLVGGRDQGGGRPNFLFRNDIGQDNRWVTVRLEGDGSAITRDAIGTRVSLSDEDTLRVRETHSSRGMYNSEDTRALHFGLDGLDKKAQLAIRWPDGTEAVFELGKDFGDDSHLQITYPDLLEVR